MFPQRWEYRLVAWRCWWLLFCFCLDFLEWLVFVNFLRLSKNVRDKWRACCIAWRTPARFPGHLSYDPFQFVAMSFPVHGGRRNVCAKGSHAAY